MKIAKRLFKKAFRDGKEPWLVLLEYKNKPVETIGSSPAQRLMFRRTKTLMPTASTLLRPCAVKGVESQIKLKRQRAKDYHDQIAKLLPPLEVGQEVRVAPLQRGKSWQAGTIVKQLSDRSYLVKTGSENIRRNRQFLRQQEQSTGKVGLETSPKVIKPNGVHVSVTPIQEITNSNAPDPVPDPVPVKCTRTRIIKPLTRFKDFYELPRLT